MAQAAICLTVNRRVWCLCGEQPEKPDKGTIENTIASAIGASLRLAILLLLQQISRKSCLGFRSYLGERSLARLLAKGLRQPFEARSEHLARIVIAAVRCRGISRTA